MENRLYKNIFWFGLAAILIFAPIARGAAAVRLWSVTPVLVVSYFLIFLELQRLNNLKPIHKEGRGGAGLKIPLILFSILAVISFIFSIYKHDSLLALLRLFAYIGVYYVVLNNFDRSMRRRLVNLAIFMGTALSAYGILQYLDLLGHSWWQPKDFLAATYVNHNHFAGYLELVIPVAFCRLMWRDPEGKKRKEFLIVALVIMSAAFILAQSRGSWICLGMSLFVMNIILVKRRMINKIILAIFLVSAAVLFSMAYLNEGAVSKRIDTIAKVEIGEASWQTRLKIWEGSIEMIKHHPAVGVGIGDFIWGFSPFRPEGLNVQANFAHNDYLQAAAEMGVAAPFIILWILAVTIGTGLSKKNFHPIRFGCALGMLSLSLHGLVDFNFHITANMLLFVIYMAFVMAPSRQKEEK